MGTAPDHGNLSNVVVIYKGNQKNSRSPSSYRPISLANSIYKVFACMIQQRLSHSIDYLLHPNQIWFRATPSLHPTFPLEATHRDFRTSFHFLVYPLSGLVTSIWLHWPPTPCGSPPQIWYPPFTRPRAVMALYHNAKFLVTDPTCDSSSYLLSRGIRQGCPLYLFITIVSALTDLHSFFQYSLDIFIHTPTYRCWICRRHTSHRSDQWYSLPPFTSSPTFSSKNWSSPQWI